MKITVKAIMVLLGILLSNMPMFAQTKNPEHHACLTGNILNVSEMKALRYNDFHGCEISDIYNIVDSCYMEVGDEKRIGTYHLAILSSDYCSGEEWNLYSDRVLLIKRGEDIFIYDNVISNEPVISEGTVPCEKFFIPSEDENNGTFNQPCDFELEYSGGQGYKVRWNIAIRISDDKLYVVGLSVWEHNASLTYSKHIAFEYNVGTFPLENFNRSMIEMVRDDRNPWND